MFGTHQGRLPQELALAKITDIEVANRYLRKVYMPSFNAEFERPVPEKRSAFVRYAGIDIGEILCGQYSRVVGNDNCVSFHGLKVQIPSDATRYHYMKMKVLVHVYPNKELGVFHGPRKLAHYSEQGKLMTAVTQVAA